MHEAVLTVDQMRTAERAAIDGGISEWELMRRAGQGVARWIWRIAAGRPVTVLCGPGNNGGDGYVIAEWLRVRGIAVLVVAPAEPTTDTSRKARSEFGGQVCDTPENGGAVLVDCLFGYGLSRQISEPFSSLLKNALETHNYAVAVDVPSGVASDSGAWLGARSRFDLTLALGAYKRAHFLMPARADMGVCRLVPIGLDLGSFPDQAVLNVEIDAPAPDAHKYTRGLLAVVAGTMPGAPLLSCEAAMRAGAGYVKLLSAHSHPDAPADLVIEDGNLQDALSDDRISACIVGPGLGRDAAARDRLGEVLAAGLPCVIDADALHLLDWDLLEGVDTSKLLLTPHDGELSRLCKSFDVGGAVKLEQADRLRDVTGAAVLAKGPDTILASVAGLRFFPGGSSWLSVAGSGDVLAGIAGARLAAHADTERAARESVIIHQNAAWIAGASFTASDLAKAVKPALESVL